MLDLVKDILHWHFISISVADYFISDPVLNPIYVLEFKESIQYPCFASNRYIFMCLFMCLDLRIFADMLRYISWFWGYGEWGLSIGYDGSFIRWTRLIDFICAYLCLTLIVTMHCALHIEFFGFQTDTSNITIFSITEQKMAKATKK